MCQYELPPSMTITDEPLIFSMSYITALQSGHRQQGSSTAYSDTTHRSNLQPSLSSCLSCLCCGGRTVIMRYELTLDCLC
jgi:hypothetical protein